MQFQVVNPFDYPDWNERVIFFENISFFNTAEWAGVLSSSYGYEPCYVVGKEGGDFSCLLPMMNVGSWLTGRRGISLPFTDYCEPVGLDTSRSESVISTLKELGRKYKWRYFEVRNVDGFGDGIPPSAEYLKHLLDLTSGEPFLYKQLESSVRTSIRKAQKAGVEVTFSDTLDAVRVFYRLNCITRRRHGLPPQPFDFFKNLHQHALSKGMGTVVTAFYEGNAIAASVFCHAGKKALYKYGASDKRFQYLRGPTLVMWEAIRSYAQGGYEQLSMGRTSVTNIGLRRFKLGWGAAESELHYFKYDLRRGRFDTDVRNQDDSGYKLVKMMPLSCSRLIGKVLYKHMA